MKKRIGHINSERLRYGTKKLPAHRNYEQGANGYVCETITSRKQQPDGWMYYPEHPYLQPHRLRHHCSGDT